jgi:hypothetical protein
MTFIINMDEDGKNSTIKNTDGTDVSFGPAKIKINGKFYNSGNVKIDVQANLEIAEDVINSGNFDIKDYVEESNYPIIEDAIAEMSGYPKEELENAYSDIKIGDKKSADNRFKKIVGYFKEHPELVTSSVQILLQLFLKTPS